MRFACRFAFCVILCVPAGCGREGPPPSPDGGDPEPAPGDSPDRGGREETPPPTIARGKVRLTLTGGGPEGDFFLVGILIATTDPDHPLQFTTWEGSAFRATDDLGNEYKPVRLPAGVRLAVGRGLKAGGGRAGMGTGAVISSRPRADVIAFQRPVDRAGMVYLELPGENVGQKDSFRFEMPRETWSARKKR